MIDFETQAMHFGPPHSSDVREEPRRRGLAFLLGRNFHEHLRHVCRLLVHRIAGVSPSHRVRSLKWSTHRRVA